MDINAAIFYELIKISCIYWKGFSGNNKINVWENENKKNTQLITIIVYAIDTLKFKHNCLKEICYYLKV